MPRWELILNGKRAGVNYGSMYGRRLNLWKVERELMVSMHYRVGGQIPLKLYDSLDERTKGLGSHEQDFDSDAEEMDIALRSRRKTVFAEKAIVPSYRTMCLESYYYYTTAVAAVARGVVVEVLFRETHRVPATALDRNCEKYAIVEVLALSLSFGV